MTMNGTNRQSASISKGSRLTFLVCLIGVLVLALLTIFPNFSTLRAQKREIASLKTMLKEHEILQPVYHALVDKSRVSPEMLLPFPEKKPLKRSKLSGLATDIQFIAEENNLTLTSIVPNLESMEGDNNRLNVDIVLTGQFMSLRRFLIKLEGKPYLEHVRSLELVKQSKTMRIKINIRILMEG